MTHALTQYNALFDSVRSRRRRNQAPTGLDALASRARVMIEHAGVTLGWLRRQAQIIDRELSPGLRSCSDAALGVHLAECREAFIRARRRTDDGLARRGLALTREVARRLTGEEAYLVQLMAAMALYKGRVVEMLTGEGKTLTGSLAAPLIAWRDRHLHVFTVNDYLARRDAVSRGEIYRRCGLTVGAIEQETDHAARAEIYSRSIVYGTPKQITADWLRDQIRLGAGLTPWAGRRSMELGESGGLGPMIPGLRAAMVDEADAVLIDEGVVPLIIARSRRTDDMAEIYRRAAAIAKTLDEGPDYTIEHLRKKAVLKPRGQFRCAKAFMTLEEPIWRARRRAEELVRQALVARHCYLRGQHYQIVDGRVVIVDEYTGRFLADRNWEHGLHQAVEAKEGVDVTADRETMARMSFQRFFRSYPFLCGMTGTAADATVEIKSVYQRPVTVIPTNRPVVRRQLPMRVFRSAPAKWAAIVDDIADRHGVGQPVLAGTRSIEASELLSQRLSARGVPHRVLNANFDKDEAHIIEQAGRVGSVIVATNMAGRGTDIKPERRALELGGLHVLLTEMHTAKRIDRQFIGRAGRQGDPGSAQIFVSLDDELIRLYARRAAAALSPIFPGEEAHGALRRVLRGLFRFAQRAAEARSRRGRAQLMRQDTWIEKHLPGM